ncbi:ankyrin repeat domain-containing protein 7-like [Chionomys nivalis]|uniref:ankyrin repeat domain-containing protein 7-like n=1 Tax=Chionomys nivalis TaxID=269649 RepID=UPI002594F187|nr:ankyrin repeat domain-containing protein 7-like [Chionomys nivalis]
MQDDFEYDALTFRAPQRTRWYTRLWPACLGHGCCGRKRPQFQLYLIGYDPVGQLQRAASVGDVALVEKFINGSEHHINESDRRGRTSLHYACAHNHPNVVAWLVSNDCTDINIQDDEGCTPLIKATQRDNVECVSILLMQGADLHIVDFGGDAALHHAVIRGNITIAGKLLKYKANIDAKTEYGLTPYKLALYERQHQMAEFLIKNGAEAHSVLQPNRSLIDPEAGLAANKPKW